MHPCHISEQLPDAGGLRGHIHGYGRGWGHSIRINDQWRICFTWKAGDAYDVEITDYH